MLPKNVDFEGKPCLELLSHIESGPPVYRTMALAMVNALNHKDALALPEDHRKNDVLFDALKIGEDTFDLEPGDSVYYLSTTPHMIASKEGRTTILAVLYEG